VVERGKKQSPKSGFLTLPPFSCSYFYVTVQSHRGAAALLASKFWG